MKKPLIRIIVVLLFAVSAHAQEPLSQTLADGTSLMLSGAGIYRDLGEEIYIGAVYLPLLDFTIKPEVSKKMEMRIAAESLSARRFTGLWTDAITLSSTREERSQIVEQILEFGGLFRENLLRGDQISFDYLASAESTVILHNGVRIGQISGATFHSILLQAWIGPAPLNSQLKAGILKELPPAELAAVAARLDALDFTETRAAEVAAQYSDKEAGELPVARTVETATLDLQAAQEEQTRREEQARRDEEIRAEAARLVEQARAAEEKARQEAEALAQREAEQRAAERRAAEEKALFEAEQEGLAHAYRLELVRWLTSHVEYPERALSRQITGRVELDIVSGREGNILQGNISTSSGNAYLDQATLKMLEKATPLPSMPETLVGDSFSFTMPVTFAL